MVICSVVRRKLSIDLEDDGSQVQHQHPLALNTNLEGRDIQRHPKIFLDVKPNSRLFLATSGNHYLLLGTLGMLNIFIE